MKPRRSAVSEEDRGLRRSLFRPGDRVLAAVSGGADSLALLLLLLRERESLQIEVAAAHIHHSQRGRAADEDAAFLAALCARLGVSLTVEKVDVPALALRAGIGLEEAGRHARYECLVRIAGDLGCNRVATAHHADDQAETVLMRLLRGTGVDGLAGIPERRPLRPGGPDVVRPLLDWTREETERFCRERGIAPRRDPCNEDPRFLRARVRHRWLPLLERESPGIRAGLLRLARQAAEDAELLDRLAGRVVEEACPELPTGVPVTIRPGPVLAAPRALGRRAVAQWLRIACGGRLDLDAAVVNRVLGMLTGEGPRVLELPGVCLRLRRGKDGLTIERGRLVLSTPPAVLLSCPGETAAPGFRLAVRISHAQVPDDPRSPPGRQWLPIESLRPPLRLRAARRGDRFRPLGAPGSRLLSDLFGGKRIPVEARGAWPLVVDEEGILWVVGLAADERARVRPGDPALLIEVEPVGS